MEPDALEVVKPAVSPTYEAIEAALLRRLANAVAAKDDRGIRWTLEYLRDLHGAAETAGAVLDR